MLLIFNGIEEVDLWDRFDINSRNKCTKFQPNPTIFGLCRLPQNFRTDRQTNRHCEILAQLKLRKLSIQY